MSAFAALDRHASRALRWAFTFTCALLALGCASTPEPVPPPSAPAPPALWARAIELAAHNRGWACGSQTISVQVLDHAGALESQQQILMREFFDDQGRLMQELVSVTLDGEDKTPEEREPKPREPEESDQVWENPFLPEVQARLELEATEQRREIEGRPARAFRFRPRERFDEADLGLAWLDAETGAPLLLEVSYRPAPVLSPVITERRSYGRTGGGGWYQREEHLDITAGWWLVEKHILVDEVCVEPLRFGEQADAQPDGPSYPPAPASAPVRQPSRMPAIFPEPRPSSLPASQPSSQPVSAPAG